METVLGLKHNILSCLRLKQRIHWTVVWHFDYVFGPAGFNTIWFLLKWSYLFANVLLLEPLSLCVCGEPLHFISKS